ncbi:hypothetical protein GCM10028805_36610 [Spirosoma harenae]
MTTKQDSDEVFELAGNDLSIWLELARWLKASAQVAHNELERVMRLDLSASDRSNTLMRPLQTFMLLTSFCFENLIKAILAGRNPGMMIVNGKLNKSLWPNAPTGHELTKLIPPDISLSAAEWDLFSRLQVYAVWGGRYPITMNSDKFHQDRKWLTYRSSDPKVIDELFFRLSQYVVY